jgi:hypothetical protein
MSTTNDNAEVSPLFLEFRPGMRKRIAAAVDALVALLDQIDGDADLEEDNPPEDDAPTEDVGDNEPSLGSVASRDASTPQYLWAQGADDDREREDEHDEEGGDEEPALGATAAMNQEHAWRAKLNAWGSSDEAEPSLGWTGHGRGHPEMALRGYDDDRERTTGPRDEEGDDADDGELDAESMDPWFNPPHLPGGNGATRRTGR